MRKLNRRKNSKLLVGIEGFLAAAETPERIEQIALLGIPAPLLERGRSLLQAWHNIHQELDQAQINLAETQRAKDSARKLAQLEMAALIALFRRQYNNEPGIMRVLNLKTRYKTSQSPEPDPDGESSLSALSDPASSGGPEPEVPEPKKVRVSSPKTESHLLQHWRQILSCIPRLPPGVMGTLNLYGFDQTRLDQIAQRVEDFAATLPLRQQAMAERKEYTRILSNAVDDLMNWVVTLRGILAPRMRLLKTQDEDQLLALMAV